MIPILPIITGLFGLGKTIAGGWVKRKKAKVEHTIKLAEMKLELKEKRLQAVINSDTEIDKINTESMATSWKDEYLLILFSIPVVMCFIPTLDVYVLAGFTALKQTPVWYQVIFVVMCLTIYGHRKLAKLFASRFLGVDSTNNNVEEK
jgi:hypothetical protein